MGIDLGSVGAAFGKDGVVGLTTGMLDWMASFTNGLGYFLGGDFQKAFDKGFMLG